MKNTRKIFNILISAGLSCVSAATFGQMQPQAVTPPSGDMAAFAAMKEDFQKAMRKMDSIICAPVSPTGPYTWEQTEARREVSNMVEAKRKFYPYGNFQSAVLADSMWATRLGFLAHGPRPIGDHCQNGNWTSVGPKGDPEPHVPNSARKDNKNGRLDRITLDPDDPNILYVASNYGGGLWKVDATTGDAQNLHTDNISVHNGVAAVAAVPENPHNRLVIATGKSYGRTDWQSWENACTGVFYSLDEGHAWNRATVTDKNGNEPFNNYGDSHFKFVSRIVVNPSHPEQLLMTMFTINVSYDPNPLNYGALFKSNDRGVTWVEVDDPNLTNRFFRDIAYNPVNPDIVYLTSLNHLYKSTDGGQHWADITSKLLNLNTAMPIDLDRLKQQWYRMEIMVPTAGGLASDGDNVALLVSHYYPDRHYGYILYRSEDAFATNISPIIPGPAEIGGTQWGVLNHGGCVMGHNPDVIYIGGNIIQRSDNGGLYYATTHAYSTATHADHQQIALPPYDGTNDGVVFVATDGGLWRSDDQGQTFQSLNKDLVVNQFYGVSASQSDNTLLSGSQDNSTIHRLQSGTWKAIAGGDGNRFSAICPVDPELYAWQDNYNDSLGISYTKKIGSTIIETSFPTTDGFSERPLAYNGRTLMAATDRMYFETDGIVTEGHTFKSGLSTMDQADFVNYNNAIFFDYCASQPDIVYASTYGQFKDSHGGFICNDSRNNNVDYNDPNGYYKFNLFKSSDGGQHWTDISPEIIGAIGVISSIAVDPLNPNKVWITYSGYNNNDGSNQNVYKSTNGGLSWQNYSNGLPLGNTEKILYMKGSPDERLFLAMESGIFYRTNSMSQWECFENGLPFTDIKDIDISYCSGKLYAATYGRGVWETDMIENIDDYLPSETNIINTNTTWGNDKAMAGSVRIKTGATLTISGATTTVFMPRNSRIIVEPGGKLVVDGAKITNECHNCEWQGIELTGNNNEPPVPQYQGSLVLKNNAILENASIAIRNFTGDNGYWGGGIIDATNSTILNCWRAVELNSYNGYSYTSQSLTSKCRFDHMHFIVDDPEIYSYHNNASDFFTSFDTKGGVEITNSEFADNMQAAEVPENKRGRGIYTLATGIKVQNCSFKGLNEGVHCEGYAHLPTRTVSVFLSDFRNINRAITLSGTAYASIKGNDISNMILNHYDPEEAYGIYLNQSAGAYIGCHNEITGALVGPTVKRYGIIVNGSADQATTIKDNIIRNTYAATQAQLDNRKLTIFCNDYQYNDNALTINPQSAGGDFTDQGTGCLPSQIRAGNTFENNQKDILSYAAPWSYYAGNGPHEIPAWWAGAMTLNQCTTDDNSQCNDFASCVYDWTTVIQGQVLSQYQLLSADGFRYRADANTLYGHIIRGYNYLDQEPQLQSFLEAENDDRSRKLLIPLYIQKGQYNQAMEAINQLSLSTKEREGYVNYYNLLINLQQSNRKMDALSPSELQMVEALADEDLEVSPYAKGYLDWWYDQEWENPIEPLPLARGTREVIEPETPGYVATSLGDAVPNPTSSKTSIDVFIGSRDAMKRPVFVIHNAMGKEMYRQALEAGENHIEVNTNTWESGIYVYNLLLNNTVSASKKLSVTK